MEHITFTLPGVQLLQLLLGAVLPLVVGLVTTRVTRSGLKAVLLAALSVVTSILTELVAALQTGEAYDLGMALLLGFGTFLVAVATHYGLLKPTGATDAAQRTLRTADTIPGEVVPAGAAAEPTFLVSEPESMHLPEPGASASGDTAHRA